MRRAIVAAAVLPIAASFLAGPAASPALAQAYLRWEQSARVAALASAGAALADDASAVFYNPAGITHLPGTHLQAGGGFTVDEARFRSFGDGAFDRDESPTLSGSLYATHAIARRLTGGFGVNAPWGFSVDWGDPGAFTGRFRSVESRLAAIQFNPVLAYGPLGPWSAAIGVDVLQTTLDLERFEQDPALSALGGRSPIALARTRLEADGTGVGWNAGVLFRPSERFSAGAQYRSRFEIDLSGRADFEIVAPEELRAIPLPQQGITVGTLLEERYVDQTVLSEVRFPPLVVAGMAVRPLDQLRIVFDVQWVGWGAVDSLRLAFTDTLLAESAPLLYDDAWAIRSGAEVEVVPGLPVRVGYAWVESPAPTVAVTPFLPDAGRDVYSAGLGFGWAGNRIDLGYRVTVLDDRQGIAFPENPGNPDGIYEGVIHEAGISVSRRL